MFSTRRIIPVLLLLVSAAACHQRGGEPQRADLLTQAQMREHNFITVYDAVTAMRAGWLNVRGPDSFTNPSEIVVYYDQTRLGGVDQMRTVHVTSVAWVRHFTGMDATMRWGVGHSAGAILISSHQ
jgi:hypothetical protein